MNENTQLNQHVPVRRLRNHGAGAVVVLFLSLGIATIVYSNNVLPFHLIDLIAWVFVPLGIFTCLYAVIARREFFYYLIWGVIMLLAGLMVVTSTFIAPMTLIGVLLIVLAVIGIVAFWRKK